jgi:DNA adenine methylase
MFPYIGGKNHHVKWIDPLLPKRFMRYVEVFGGAGWMMVKSRKVEQSTERVYNDFNPYLANVFECMRSDPTRLMDTMESTPCGNLNEFRSCQKELFGGDFLKFPLGDFDMARKYLYLQTQVFAGTPLSAKCVPYFTEQKANGKYPSKYNTLIRKLQDPRVTDRLTKITEVTQQDCIDVIDRWDSEDTLFYVDPPYHNKEFYYSQDFPKQKHEDLANRLRNIKGKFALSYYDFDDLHQFYPKDSFHWHQQEVYRSAATRSGKNKDYKEKSRGTEILLTNYSNPANFERLFDYER